nr:H508 [uncultured bacterium]
MVLVCVDKQAETARIIARHGSFGVSILASGQESISNACARKGTPESSLDGVDYCVGSLGLPLLTGCLASFECRTMHEYDGGDHIIFAGQVESGSVGEASEPLLYFRGAYGAFT